MAAKQAEVLRCTGKWQHENIVQPWAVPKPDRCMACKADLVHVSGPRLVGAQK